MEKRVRIASTAFLGLAFVASTCIALSMQAQSTSPESPIEGVRNVAVSNLSVEKGAAPIRKEQSDTGSIPKAQEKTSTEPEKAMKTNSPDSEKSLESRGSFLIAPIPISSSAVGVGVVPVVGYIFPFNKNDKESPPSVIGAVGFVTNNGTHGFFVGGNLRMKRNTYAVTAIYAHGNLNYDLYGVGINAGDAGLKLPLKQTGQAFLGEVSRRIGWKIFVGARFWSGESTVTLRPTDNVEVPPVPPDLGLHTTLRALGVRVNRDTRPNRFYPTTGTLLNFTSDFFATALGSKYSFQSYQFTFNKYGSIKPNQVLAYNLFICGTGGKPPFYGNCIYGTNNELRGYTAGQYLDRYMFATQLEYRLSLPKGLGLAGFGGIGEVIPGAGQLLRSKQLLPAIGAGPRYSLSKKYHVNLRADFARGKDSWTWSMGIGEAF